MDVAYNQHSPHFRHQGRSSTNLNHLTLAPLTSRLPLSDPDALPDTHHSSYIEGRSAPTTPSILSQNTSRVSLRRPAHVNLPKSKSSIQIAQGKMPRSSVTTPSGTKLRKPVTREELNFSTLSVDNRNDSDWLLRAGATITSSARESKGQAWLVSRASSTSLTAQGNEDDDLERELAREREQTSRRNSRRGSATGDADDEFSPITTRRSLSFGPPTDSRSHPLSRFGSRNNSRRGSKAQLFANAISGGEGYFDYKDMDFANEEFIAEPDFVEVEEEGFENYDEAKKDEATVRKLAKAHSLGVGGWVEKMLGWSLFAVEEDGEDANDTDIETMDEKDAESSYKMTRPNAECVADPPSDPLPPLRDEDAGGWQDAAWLLSVATKVLL